MARLDRSTFVCILFVCAASQLLSDLTFATDLDALIESSCIDCHDANTETLLDFTTLGKDFENAESFRIWVRVFDRIKSGEMPPPGETQLGEAERTKALSVLGSELKRANQQWQKEIGAWRYVLLFLMLLLSFLMLSEFRYPSFKQFDLRRRWQLRLDDVRNRSQDPTLSQSESLLLHRVAERMERLIRP